jgi:hypothetical protein
MSSLRQSPDRLGGLHLLSRVEAVAGLVVDRGRNEEPDFVVVTQRLDAYARQAREPTDRA